MYSWFRNCKSCGHGIFKNRFHPINFFCDECFLKLENHKAPLNVKIFKEPGIIIKPLYLWKEKESEVAHLIHGLKGGKPLDFLSEIAMEISRRNTVSDGTIIIPVPPSKVGEKDHSHHLAKLVSRQLNCVFWDGLKWKNKRTHQKFLNKTERFRNEMERTKTLPKCKKIILVDDLVTTGGTVFAAHKAIKSPKQIEVWSVACRI